MLVDTHAHLFWEGLRDNLEKVVRRAREAGVEKIIVPGVDLESSKESIKIAERFKGVVYAAVGLHPEVLEEEWEWRKAVKTLEEMIVRKRGVVVGVGEVGMDMYHEGLRKKKKEQEEMFEMMVRLGKKYVLPLIVHSRGAEKEVWERVKGKGIRGVFHCFGGGEQVLEEIVRSKNWWVSYGGNVTWSKRIVRLLNNTPLERLLLETDSPFLLPQELRGQNLRNEPANVRILAEKEAEILGVELEKVEKQTRINTKRLFKV